VYRFLIEPVNSGAHLGYGEQENNLERVPLNGRQSSLLPVNCDQRRDVPGNSTLASCALPRILGGAAALS